MRTSRVSAIAGAIAVAAATCPTAIADDALPSCPRTTAVINPERQLDHTDCHLQSADRVGLGFDVTYWPAGAATPKAARVVVTDPSGEVTQTIDELLEPSSPAGVGLQDLDGDGRNEVIIPMNQSPFNGGLNTRFSVWRPVGDSMHFERTQMVGQAVYPSGDGYVVTNGGALTSRDLTFYQPTNAGFTLIVSLTIGAEQVEPGTGRVLKVSCRAHQQQGLQMVGMNVYQAEDTFCSSPAARAIWPDAARIPIRR
ncbi:hypothetical protein ABQF35_09415 [Mycobacterium syngnathidarum]